jgi:hypothetical protein
MSGPRSLAALVLLALVIGVAGLATAAGELDGIYLVTLNAEGVEPITYALVATQNGSQLVLILLDFLDNPLVFAVGNLTAQQQLSGPLLFSDGVGAGELSVTFQGANVAGRATLFERQFGLAGTKAF